MPPPSTRTSKNGGCEARKDDKVFLCKHENLSSILINHIEVGYRVGIWLNGSMICLTSQKQNQA